MFGKLKEKLKSWFRKSEKKAEEELVEEPVKEEKLEEEKIEGEEEPIEKPTFLPVEKPVKLEKRRFLEILRKKCRISEQYIDEIFNPLETIFLENNVALETVDYLRESLKKELEGTEVDKKKIEETIRVALKISLESLFAEPFDIISQIKEKQGVFIILFFGINGTGKTTTIAKLSYLLKENNISSVFAASDTFRAASIEQLKKHGEKLGVKVIHQTYGSDPTAVAYDAIEYAKAHKIKVVMIDTAGRMHTKENLMKEMEKICRVTKPDLKIFIAESIAGNDAIEQAKTFNEAAGIDGIILTKAEIDEKGGTALSISQVIGKPILFLGTGQEYFDLQPFDKNRLIKELGF